MSIRAEAVSWFQTNIGASNKKLFSSKFYTADQAWPKQNSWWFEIPLERLKENATSDFHLLCQKSPHRRDFYYLKIPAQYFLSHLDDLTIQKRGTVSIFPSAEENRLFQDQRGRCRLNFRSFLTDLVSEQVRNDSK